MRKTSSLGRTNRAVARSCLGLALLAGLAALAAGLGHRFGWWGFEAGFAILRWAVYGGFGVAVISLYPLGLSIYLHAWRHLILAALALAMGAATLGVPLSYAQKARLFPPIHDITTDVENPPPFIAVLPLREGAANSADHGGDRVSAMQLKAYPDLGPVTYRLPPSQVFPRVVALAEEFGWNIVSSLPEQGWLEATETSFWFGFTDDIVVRVGWRPEGSVVDIRSASREGVSDLGVNAARIQKFIDRLVAGSIQ